MGRSRYKNVNYVAQPYFVTCAVVNWIAIFGNVEVTRIIINSLNFLQKQNRLSLHGYVILENHLHLIVSAENLSKEIGNFKSFTAKSIISFFKEKKTNYILDQFKFYKKQHKERQEYQLWQEGFHPQVIIGDNMLVQKLEYIHNNPVKRGYVNDPAHWRYSSYSNYHGEEGIITICPIEL